MSQPAYCELLVYYKWSCQSSQLRGNPGEHQDTGLIALLKKPHLSVTEIATLCPQWQALECTRLAQSFCVQMKMKKGIENCEDQSLDVDTHARSRASSQALVTQALWVMGLTDSGIAEKMWVTGPGGDPASGEWWRFSQQSLLDPYKWHVYNHTQWD